ncbi:unnamed protein product [Prunus armeniaca]|uniref:CCHC-type domain-containing protein n=1 Tax=Prunus armeniaca TaxID=36596 RepID=A0A6J5XCC9_PRUAR|nr:unnamed protein product [Prunus armeniaca]
MSKLSSPPFSSHPLPISFNISSLFPVPMDRTNYLSWKSQFEDVLEMHGLATVVKNNTNPPKVQEDGSVHPELAKDKLTLLIPCTTAHQAWTMLAKRLSPLASTRVWILRDQIRTLRKDTNTTVTDYLNYAKSLFDSLTQAGATMDDDELISYVLDGLGLEYKELATTLHLHPDIDFDKFYDLALREEHLQKRMSLTAASGVAMAADRRSTERNSSPNSTGHNPTHSYGSGRGRGRGRNWNQGHNGHRRTQSHDQQHASVVPSFATLTDGRPPLLPTPHGNSPNTQRADVICFRCDKPGHIACFCPDRRPHAYMATNTSTPSQSTYDVANLNWCFDSGATHHMTADPTSLPHAQPYTGQQDGDGTPYWQ